MLYMLYTKGAMNKGIMQPKKITGGKNKEQKLYLKNLLLENQENKILPFPELFLF